MIACAAVLAPPAGGGQPAPPGPGDFRQGYDSETYVTRSRRLRAAPGRRLDLLALAADPPLGLPPVPIPDDNPLSQRKIRLGQKLFFDRRLSPNDTMSCAMCHVPEHGFTHNEMKTAIGIAGQIVRRNAPSLFNVAYHERLFHDGRESSLETQVWSPLLAANEMGNHSVGAVIGKIERLADYDGEFEAAFDRGPGMETIALALASYQRTLLAANSPFDRWRYGDEADALDDSARRGLAIFTGKGNCASCHTIGAEYALFTDGRFHNTGVGHAAPAAPPATSSRVLLAPGQAVTVSVAGLEHLGLRPPRDLGRYEITGRPDDRWKYRTPSLRNVSLSAPYMHDGSLATLEAVVRFYDRGGVPGADLDPLIRPLGLSEQEITDVVSFLESLTGAGTAALIGDALTAPVGT